MVCVPDPTFQRLRNRAAMNKFRKPRQVGRFKKPSTAVAEKRARAKADEDEFMAKLFQFPEDEEDLVPHARSDFDINSL